MSGRGEEYEMRGMNGQKRGAVVEEEEDDDI
jgi:hypothetical protein